MDLIKKTVILTGEKTNGYVTIIKVGEDVGAKIVGEDFDDSMRGGIRIGKNDIFFFTLDGKKTEREIKNVTLKQSDNVSCVIVDKDNIVARGGNGIRALEIIDHFAEKNVSDVPSHMPDEEEKEAQKEELLDRLSAKDGAEYYGKVKESLEELFVIYPREEKLEGIFPDSEWVKINYEETDYYVIGKIKERDRTVMIGYGVPGKRDVPPPRIADGIFSWLSVEMEEYDGYWLLFQDANTGKLLQE